MERKKFIRNAGLTLTTAAMAFMLSRCEPSGQYSAESNVNSSTPLASEVVKMTPIVQPTDTPTFTPSPTETTQIIQTAVPTNTQTPEPTKSPTPTSTQTRTPTPTATETSTPAPTEQTIEEYTVIEVPAGEVIPAGTIVRYHFVNGLAMTEDFQGGTLTEDFMAGWNGDMQYNFWTGYPTEEEAEKDACRQAQAHLKTANSTDGNNYVNKGYEVTYFGGEVPEVCPTE